MTTTGRQIDAAIKRGRLESPRIAEARYDEVDDEIGVRFENGMRVMFPRCVLEGLSAASPDQLRDIVIAGPGTGIYWPQLDVAHYVPGLMDGVFGTRRWMQELGRRGGATKAPAKVAAARNNGKKGGRPKKSAGLN